MTQDEKDKMKDTYRYLLEYEISSSWWPQYIFWDWGQKLASSYFSRKVLKKVHRFQRHMLDRGHNYFATIHH